MANINLQPYGVYNYLLQIPQKKQGFVFRLAHRDSSNGYYFDDNLYLVKKLPNDETDELEFKVTALEPNSLEYGNICYWKDSKFLLTIKGAFATQSYWAYAEAEKVLGYNVYSRGSVFASFPLPILGVSVVENKIVAVCLNGLNSIKIYAQTIGNPDSIATIGSYSNTDYQFVSHFHFNEDGTEGTGFGRRELPPISISSLPYVSSTQYIIAVSDTFTIDINDDATNASVSIKYASFEQSGDDISISYDMACEYVGNEKRVLRISGTTDPDPDARTSLWATYNITSRNVDYVYGQGQGTYYYSSKEKCPCLVLHSTSDATVKGADIRFYINGVEKDAERIRHGADTIMGISLRSNIVNKILTSPFDSFLSRFDEHNAFFTRFSYNGRISYTDGGYFPKEFLGSIPHFEPREWFYSRVTTGDFFGLKGGEVCVFGTDALYPCEYSAQEYTPTGVATKQTYYGFNEGGSISLGNARIIHGPPRMDFLDERYIIYNGDKKTYIDGIFYNIYSETNYDSTDLYSYNDEITGSMDQIDQFPFRLISDYDGDFIYYRHDVAWNLDFGASSGDPALFTSKPLAPAMSEYITQDKLLNEVRFIEVGMI